MKPNHLFISMLVVTALFVASCSTSKLAKNNAISDDVYNTTAQAKEYKEVVIPQQTTAQTDGQNNDYYGTSDPYYEQDYATRINRFYYANPWRTYYDGYYGFSPFGYNSFYSPYYGYGLGSDILFNPYYNYSFYGAPYYSNYWGLYSYNYPYYGGGYGGGGYYGSVGGIRGGSNPNYGPRPVRGSENGINRTNGTSYSGGSNGITDRNSSASRAERYNPTNSASGNTTRPSGTTSSTPTRSSAGDSRPTRSNDSPPPTRTYSPPTQSAPPPSSSSSGSRGESSGSSSSGGGGGGGGRPTRGGGR